MPTASDPATQQSPAQTAPDQPTGVASLPSEPPAQLPAAIPGPVTPPPGDLRGPATRTGPSSPVVRPRVEEPLAKPPGNEPTAKPPQDNPNEPNVVPGPSTKSNALTFTGARFLTVVDEENLEVEAILSFGPADLRVITEEDKSVFKALPYGSIAGATYSRSVQPRAGGFGGAVRGGIRQVGRLFGRDKPHWLTIRMRGDSVALRLDKQNYQSVIETLEKRTGIKVAVQAEQK